MLTQQTGTAQVAGSGLVSWFFRRWAAALLLLVSALLVSSAWPRLHASLQYLPVDSALARYFETREIPEAQLQALSERAAKVVSEYPHHRYWYGLSLLRYLQALEPATPRWERDPSLRRSLGAGTEALARSPVNPYAWYQVAQVRSALEQPASEVVSALEMSMLTGRVEPNLLLPRIELGATYLSSLDDGQRAQVSDQVGLAMQLKRSQILRSVRDGRLDFEALRQLAPPGLEAELDTMEKRLGPAS